jgi:DNA primase large subunit
VPFEQVPDLVSTRRVFLRRGLAYVAKDQIASLVVAHFRARLARGLALTARRWATHVADAEADRLTPVVESLSSRCVRLIATFDP